jgi:hypothetical protein
MNHKNCQAEKFVFDKFPKKFSSVHRNKSAIVNATVGENLLAKGRLPNKVAYLVFSSTNSINLNPINPNPAFLMNV